MAWSAAEHQRKWTQGVREEVRKAKDKPCADCGVEYPYYVMDFDHREGEIKQYNVNKMPGRHGLPAILREIAKCDVVCSNCHRRRTWTRMQ